MTTIAEILSRITVTLMVENETMAADLCREVAKGLREIYPDGHVPAAEAILAEELFLIRITSHKMEHYLGIKGLFMQRGENSAPVLHPAMATTMKNRERYKKIWNNLAWRHGVAGLQPSREKALAKLAQGSAQPAPQPVAAPKPVAVPPASVARMPVVPAPSAANVPPNVGPLVNPDVVARIVNGSGKVTREDFLRPGKVAVAV